MTGCEGNAPSFRRWCLVSALAVLITAGVPASTATRAGAGESASTRLCTFETRNHATPGFSLTRTEGVDRASGTISCRDAVGGPQAGEARGTIRFVFSYGTGQVSRVRGGDDCLAFSGHGTMDITLPSDQGIVTVEGPVESSGAGAAGAIHGRLGSRSLSGVLEFVFDPDYPDENCVTKPIQHFITHGELALN